MSKVIRNLGEGWTITHDMELGETSLNFEGEAEVWINGYDEFVTKPTGRLSGLSIPASYITALIGAWKAMQ